MNPSTVEQLESNGMLFVGHDDDGKRMEIMELQGTYFYCFLHSSFSVILLQGWITRIREKYINITRNILDCNQSNYSSHIIFSCRLFLQAAV